MVDRLEQSYIDAYSKLLNNFSSESDKEIRSQIETGNPNHRNICKIARSILIEKNNDGTILVLNREFNRNAEISNEQIGLIRLICSKHLENPRHQSDDAQENDDKPNSDDQGKETRKRKAQDEVDEAEVLRKKQRKAEEERISSLIMAIETNNDRKVKLCLKDIVDINILDSLGRTPLHVVLIKGKTELANDFINKGADITIPNSQGITPLQFIYQKDLTDIVKLLIRRNGINATYGKDGDTLLTTALKQENTSVANFLINNGADITIPNAYGETPFDIICQKENPDIVVTFLIEKNGINATYGENGKTLLAIALQKGNIEISRLLINKGADLNIPDTNGETSLQIACKEEHQNIVEMLIKINGINAKYGEDNNTLLAIAIELGSKKIVKLLIDRGADTNIPNDLGNTPFHIACANGDLDIVELLINKVDINAKHKNGYTPLFIALNTRKTETAKFLIDRGADIKMPNVTGSTPFHIACAKGLQDIVELLIDKVDINAQNTRGNTPLIAALFAEKTEIAKILINRGADINIPDYDGNTPFHIACENGLQDIVEQLIDKVNKNAKNKNGDTPLITALNAGKTEIAKFLINTGADINIPDTNGNSPFHLACINEQQDIIELLIGKVNINGQNKIGETPLITALNAGKTEIAKFLIDRGADINIPDSDGNPPFHIACSYGHLDIVELLIDMVNINAKNNTGDTPLTLALGFNKIEVAKFLIKRGADFKIPSMYGFTPFHFACMHGHLDIVEQLFNEVDITAQSNSGMTPLIAALFNQNVEIAKFIIENAKFRVEDLDINIPDEEGNTPFHIACENGYKDIVELLIDNVDINGQNNEGKTPLLNATDLFISNTQQGLPVIRTLLTNGADPTISTLSGVTPWSVLTQYNDFTNPLIYVVADLFLPHGFYKLKDQGGAFLLKVYEANNIAKVVEYALNGASIFGQNVYGESIASSIGNNRSHDLINILRACKIDIKKMKPDRHGDLLIHIAVKTGNQNLFDYLIEHGSSLTEKNTYGDTPLECALYEYFSNRDIGSYIIFTILEKYIENSRGILRAGFEHITKYEEFIAFILEKIPDLLNGIQEGVNPLELALALNNPHISRAIVNTLGEEQFQTCFDKLSSDARRSFKELIQYELNNAHFVQVASMPDQPEEPVYQIEAFLDMFDELATKMEPGSLKPKLRQYLLGSDKNETIANLRSRMQTFITSCKNRDGRSGLDPGREEEFWGTIERAMTNTLKALINYEGDDADDKKMALLGEYLNDMVYCATRLDIDFEKLYFENSGTVRSFQDEIYFLLSERRRITVEGLAPRGPQSIHHIQRMLKQLDQYAIPIKQNPDMFPQDLDLFDSERSFLKKYQDGLLTDIKNLLKSNEVVQEMYFTWLEENGLVSETSIPKEIGRCFDYIQQHGSVLEDAPKLWKDIYVAYDKMPKFSQDLSDLDNRKETLNAYFSPDNWMVNDFEKIKQAGSDAFDTLDPQLQEAIIESGMRDKLSLFQDGTPAKITAAKKKIMNRYIENQFPEMAKKIRDEDVGLLLQKFGVLEVAQDCPEWLKT